jgi:hypothetical protein
VGPNEGVTRRQLEEVRSLALWNFLQGRSDAPFGLGHVRAAMLQPVLDPLLGEPGLGLGRMAVDVGQGRPLHLGADRTLAVGGVGTPVRGGTLAGPSGIQCYVTPSRQSAVSVLKAQRAICWPGPSSWLRRRDKAA